jgi:hypothetical protein
MAEILLNNMLTNSLLTNTSSFDYTDINGYYTMYLDEGLKFTISAFHFMYNCFDTKKENNYRQTEFVSLLNKLCKSD